MTTPTGSISFENLRSEFGGPQANNSLNNYYSNGPRLGAPLANVPSSGAINMGELKNIDKRDGNGNQVNIASGVPNSTHVIFTTSGDCYSNSTSTPALTLSGSRTGATTLVISHGVYGKSGSGGNGQPVTFSDNGNAGPTGSAGNGSSGGTAISLGSPVHVDNNSTVYGGSGGGGGGSAFGANITGNISNGITCTSSTTKGITTNTNGGTAFTIGTGGSGGGGGNQANNNADGAGGSAGGGGHTTNFASGNQSVTTTGTQCSANSSYFSGRIVKLVSNQGNFSNTVGVSGGSNGGSGSSANATSGNIGFPGVNANGVNVSSLPVSSNGDGSSGGGAGNSFSGFNTYNQTVHGIGSTSGITGGNFS
jgi:hypothetical protein